jgi:hypothetical protein
MYAHSEIRLYTIRTHQNNHSQNQHTHIHTHTQLNTLAHNNNATSPASVGTTSPLYASVTAPTSHIPMQGTGSRVSSPSDIHKLTHVTIVNTPAAARDEKSSSLKLHTSFSQRSGAITSPSANSSDHDNDGKISVSRAPVHLTSGKDKSPGHEGVLMRAAAAIEKGDSMVSSHEPRDKAKKGTLLGAVVQWRAASDVSTVSPPKRPEQSDQSPKETVVTTPDEDRHDRGALRADSLWSRNVLVQRRGGGRDGDAHAHAQDRTNSWLVKSGGGGREEGEWGAAESGSGSVGSWSRYRGESRDESAHDSRLRARSLDWSARVRRTIESSTDSDRANSNSPSASRAKTPAREEPRELAASSGGRSLRDSHGLSLSRERYSRVATSSVEMTTFVEPITSTPGADNSRQTSVSPAVKRCASADTVKGTRDEWLRSRAAGKAANMRVPSDEKDHSARKEDRDRSSARDEEVKKRTSLSSSASKASAAAARTPKDDKRHSVGEDKRNVSWGAAVASLSGSAHHHADTAAGGLGRASRYKRELRELDDL